MSRAEHDPKRTPQGRPGERRDCSRKKRMTRIGALLAASRWGGRAYRCPYCTGWHHTKGGKR